MNKEFKELREILKRLLPSEQASWINPSKPMGSWSGQKSDALKLLSLIEYNDFVIREILKNARLYLKRYAPDHLISFAKCLEEAEKEYYSGNRSRSKECFTAIARAIYECIKEDYHWVYEWEPYGPFKEYQQVRRISHIYAERILTCLEAVLSFASCLEAVHYNPLVIHLRYRNRTNCHAIAGFWMIPISEVLQEKAVLEGFTVLNYIREKKIEVIDCTGFADGKHSLSGRSIVGKLSFEEAQRLADQYLNDKDWQIDFSLNVRTARELEVMRGCEDDFDRD